jgi:peptide/nickel transport system substrate-binding protein
MADDPARAADLLTEAGWTTSDEGIRMKGGMPLQFSVVANGDNPIRRALALFLVESWREIGIDARVQFETWGSVRDRITTSREFDALVLGYRWEIDPDQHAMWSSVSIAHGYNLSGYVNFEVDRLLDEATAMTDDDLRSESYAEVQNIVMTDLPVLPLAFPNQTFAIGPRLRDIEPTAILVRNRAAIAEWVPVRNDEKGESDD